MILDNIGYQTNDIIIYIHIQSHTYTNTHTHIHIYIYMAESMMNNDMNGFWKDVHKITNSKVPLAT